MFSQGNLPSIANIDVSISNHSMPEPFMTHYAKRRILTKVTNSAKN